MPGMAIIGGIAGSGKKGGHTEKCAPRDSSAYLPHGTSRNDLMAATAETPTITDSDVTAGKSSAENTTVSGVHVIRVRYITHGAISMSRPAKACFFRSSTRLRLQKGLTPYSPAP